VIDQFIRGLPVTRRVKCKHISNSKRIKMSTDQLALGTITRKEFLIQVSHSVDGYLTREGNWARYIENDGQLNIII